MVTLQSAEQALKTVYLGTLTELLNTRANPLLSKIEMTSDDVWGKEIRTAAKIGINGGIGAGDEDGDLPTPNQNNYLQFTSTLKNLYGQIEISDKAIRASDDKSGSFTNLLNAELEGLLNASKFNLGRMLYGDGSGLLATASAASSAKELTLDKVNNLIEGLVIDIYGSDGSTKKGTFRIKYVDRASNKITIDNSATIAVGDMLYVQGSKGKEISGIGAIFNGNNLYGLKKSDYPFLKPYDKSITGDLTEATIQEAIDTVENNSGSTIDFIACSQEAKYAFIKYMSGYKRNLDYMELKGGFKTLSYNGIPLVYDRFVPKGVMYLLNTKSFKLHQLCDWQFLETENGKILRQNLGKPTYTATLVKYCDLICSMPNGQARISGITA